MTSKRFELIERATTGCSPTSKRSKLLSSSIELIEPTEHRWQQLCSTYKLAENISIIQAMMRQESTRYKPHHYLEDTAVTEQDRSRLCTWGYDITTACGMNPKVAAITIGYFDRFMSNRNTRTVEACLADQREFQLAFIVSSTQHDVLLRYIDLASSIPSVLLLNLYCRHVSSSP